MTGFSCSLSLELNMYHDRQCLCVPYRNLQNSKKCNFYSCQKTKNPATQHLMHPFSLGPCTFADWSTHSKWLSFYKVKPQSFPPLE